MKLSLSSHLQTRCDLSFKAVYLSQHLPFSVFSDIRNYFLILIHARQHTYRNGNKNSCYNLSVSLYACCTCYIKLGKDLRFGRGLRDHLVQLSRARIKTVVFIALWSRFFFSHWLIISPLGQTEKRTRFWSSSAKTFYIQEDRGGNLDSYA